ncbi:hypothetical protein ACHAXS_002657, partial [Conticribra weissflogii]
TRRRSSTYLYGRNEEYDRRRKGEEEEEEEEEEEKQLEYAREEEDKEKDDEDEKEEKEENRRDKEKPRQRGNDERRHDHYDIDHHDNGNGVRATKVAETANDDRQARDVQKKQVSSPTPTRHIPSSDCHVTNNTQASSDEEDERADGIGNFGTDRNSIVGNKKYQRQHGNHGLPPNTHYKSHADSHATFQTELMSTSTISNSSYQNLTSSRQHHPSQARANSQVMVQLLQGGVALGSSRSGSIVTHGSVPGATATASGPSSTGRDDTSRNPNDVHVISENAVVPNGVDHAAKAKMGKRISRRELYRKTKCRDRESLHLSDSDSDSESESIFGNNPYRESVGDLTNDVSTRSIMIDEEEDEEYQRLHQLHHTNKDDCSNVASAAGNGSLSDVGGGRRARRRVSNFLFKNVERREDGVHASSGSTHGSYGWGAARGPCPPASRSPSSEKTQLGEGKEAMVAHGLARGDSVGSSIGNSTSSGGRRGLERRRSGSQRGPNPYAFF